MFFSANRAFSGSDIVAPRSWGLRNIFFFQSSRGFRNLGRGARLDSFEDSSSISKRCPSACWTRSLICTVSCWKEYLRAVTREIHLFTYKLHFYGSFDISRLGNNIDNMIVKVNVEKFFKNSYQRYFLQLCTIHWPRRYLFKVLSCEPVFLRWMYSSSVLFRKS